MIKALLHRKEPGSELKRIPGQSSSWLVILMEGHHLLLLHVLNTYPAAWFTASPEHHWGMQAIFILRRQRTMQKPHVLQWLALGGLQMLHVEQYLSQSCLLSGRGHIKLMALQSFFNHSQHPSFFNYSQHSF